MSFIFYDTETTGTNRDFDQILQFAAILTDNDLQELDRFEIGCRCLPWVVPGPMALKVTGIHPDRLSDPDIPSFYSMMCAIQAKLESWGQAIYVGYNSMRFDEPLLQRAFWQSLHPPYRTVTGGSARMDLFPLVQAASHLTKDTLAIPQNDKGRAVFKLDRLAPLNGFAHANAHDALADVEATIHIARLLAERSRVLWSHAIRQCAKTAKAALTTPDEPTLVVEYFGSPAIWWGLRLDEDGAASSSAYMARLDSDWEALRSDTDEVFAMAVRASPKPVRALRLNQAPLLFSMEQAQSLWGLAPSEDDLRAVEGLRGDAAFRTRLLTAAKSEAWPDPQYLEQMMVGSFPSRGDEAIMRRFHQENWVGKAALIREFEDERLQRLAQRLVYLEAPHLLSADEVARLGDAIRERLHSDHTDKTLWRTISSALQELEEVRAMEGGAVAAAAIETYLRNIAAPTGSHADIVALGGEGEARGALADLPENTGLRVLYDVPGGYVRHPDDIDGSYEMLDREDQLEYLTSLAERGNVLASELLLRLQRKTEIHGSDPTND